MPDSAALIRSTPLRMDNTDGVGQSLFELAEASKCAFVIRRSTLQIPPLVTAVSENAGKAPLDIIFNGGADFSLTGTIRGTWTSEQASRHFGHTLEINGCVEPGHPSRPTSQNRSPRSHHRGKSQPLIIAFDGLFSVAFDNAE